MVITDVAMLVATRNFVSPRFPIKPVSTIPTKGIAKFEKNTGMDNKKICFVENFVENFVNFIFSALKYVI